MLVPIAIILSVVGILFMIFGWVPISTKRHLAGLRARGIGCVLFLTWPSLFVVGAIGGVMTAFNYMLSTGMTPSNATLLELFEPYVDFERAMAILAVLLAVLVIAYWPTRARPKADSGGPLPTIERLDQVKSQYPDVSFAAAAFRLGIPDREIQKLVGEGQLRTVDGGIEPRIEGRSLHALLRFRHGIDLASRGELKFALDELSDALRINPGLTPAYLMRGRIYFEIGELDSAHRDMQAVLTTQPENQEAASLLGQIQDPEAERAANVRRGRQSPLVFFLRSVKEAIIGDFRHIPWFLGAIALLAWFIFPTFIELNTSCSADGRGCGVIPAANTHAVFMQTRDTRYTLTAAQRIVAQTAYPQTQNAGNTEAATWATGTARSTQHVENITVSPATKAVHPPNLVFVDGRTPQTPYWIRPVLTIGGKAMITNPHGDLTHLRDTASSSGKIARSLRSGALVDLLDGPQNAEGLHWWQVRADDGTVGWVADQVAYPDGMADTLKPVQ